MIKEKSFISKNEENADIITTKILSFAILTFPDLIILGLIQFFPFDMKKLYIVCIIGAIGASAPFILRKINVNCRFIKYFTIVMETLVIGVLNINKQSRKKIGRNRKNH